MQIYGPSSIHSAHAISPAHLSRARETHEVRSTALPQDEVRISEMGHMLESLANVPDVRQERVDRIRQEIAAGTYDSDARLDAAVNALLNELLG